MLYNIRALWYDTINSESFRTIEEFLKKYRMFQEFVGQLAFLYFKGFMPINGSSKLIDKYLEKLTDRTSNFIITHTTSWDSFTEKKLLPLIRSKRNSGKSLTMSL